MKKENVGKQFAESFAEGNDFNAKKPAREKIVTSFDCAKTFDGVLELLKEVETPLQVHIENKGSYFIVNWLEKLD